MGELERVFDSNQKESRVSKNDYERLLGFVDGFKNTYSKSNLLKSGDQQRSIVGEHTGGVMECYRECMGQSKVG